MPVFRHRTIDPVLMLSDLPAWGRVALALDIPLLERRGIQVCALPTALLSTHGAYAGAVVQAQTGFLERAIGHLEGLDLRFSAVCTGFIAERAQFAVAAPLVSARKADGALVLVDPIMGDNGRLYGFFDQDFVDAMRAHAGLADLITPNLTEAALLLGQPADACPASRDELRAWMAGLAALGPRFVVLTSAPVHGRSDHTGVALFDAVAGRFHVLAHARLAPGYPGTGDYFAAELLAGLLRGRGFFAAARTATARVRRALARSRRRGGDPRAGLRRL